VEIHTILVTVTNMKFLVFSSPLPKDVPRRVYIFRVKNPETKVSNVVGVSFVVYEVAGGPFEERDEMRGMRRSRGIRGKGPADVPF
jgi:hypothetical protein